MSNYAPVQGPTCLPRELVRLVVPDATDAEADYLLWEQSCYPFGSWGHWLAQIREFVGVRVQRGEAQ